MVSKTHYNKFVVSPFQLRKGLTLFELLVVITLVTVGAVTVFLFANPAVYKQKSRDSKRISDISTLERAISEYLMDNGVYPDDVDTTRTSTTQTNVTITVDSPAGGWIDADLTAYTTKLPLDPLNEDTYVYSYRHDNAGYELNARLEYLVEYSQNDGGSDATVYEVGNNLSLL